MMSLGKVVDAASAAAYYGEVDDYYFEGHAPTRWLGDGAARLGLNGEVKKNDFTALLKGEMRDGTQMRVGGDGSRRAATDLTFSAPKSVSMQALVGGDARLVDAHEKAVARTLKYVEENVASYRERIGDTVVRHASNNLIVATIRHDVSRSVDPQLHTHCVVLNATETRDGQWRALDQTPLYQQQKLLGALYRSELAIEVQRLGYSVRQTHADGRFELGHIGDQQIKAFSQRSAAIESRLALDGKTRQDASAHAKEAAALSTRQAKTDINHAEVMRGWQEKSRALQVDYAPPVKAYASDANSRQAAANDSVKFAIAHLTERKSIVDEHQVLAAALGAGTGRTDIKSIRQSLSGETFSGNLLRSREGRLTTTAAQQSERELLGVEWRGRGGVVPVMNSRDAAAALRGSPLNAGQREAVKLIATSGNRVVGIQGIAGGGKTTMLDTANRLAASRGYRVVGLAPSAAAVHQLEKVRIRSQTIAAFQHTTQTGLNSKTLVIIDEAGMVGTQDMHRVLHAVEAAGARAVLVGDSRQLKAVRAGQPFAQLQDNGMTAVHMQDIVRQRDAVLKNAVELAAKGNIHQAIARLEKSIVEIDHTRDRHAAMARDFAALDPKARAATLIVAGSRSARASLNDCVRRELGLAGTGVTIAVLEGKDLTEAQIRTTRSYEQGDVIQAERNYPSLGLVRGDRATVVGVGKTKVTLQCADGVEVEWTTQNQQNMTAYHLQEREVAIGDKLRLTQNDYSKNITNGETGIVTAIDKVRDSITIEKSSGESVTLSIDEALHLDHGYASTVHAAQGATCERVMFDADTRSVMANEAQFYVAISRATDEVTVYTDDRTLLPDAMDAADLKEAALDLKPEREAAALDMT